MSTYSQTHLPPRDPRAVALASAFFPDLHLESVKRISIDRPGQCYENVRNKISQEGGAIQFGWLLSVQTGHFVEAIHHAVWCNNDGILLDVTGPAYPAMTGEDVTFVRSLESQIIWSHLVPMEIPKFLLLTDSLSTVQYTEVVQKLMICRRRLIMVSVEEKSLELKPHGPSFNNASVRMTELASEVAWLRELRSELQSYFSKHRRFPILSGWSP